MCVMKEEIIAKLEQLPDALKNSMLENFQIEGTVPITRHEMHDMMKASVDDLKKTIEESLQSLALRGQDAPVTGPNTTVSGEGGRAVQSREAIKYTVWNWKGKFHPVPPNFEFPV